MRKPTFLVLLIIFFNCNLFAQSISKDEYKIYEVVLDKIAAGDSEFSFVILNKTQIVDLTITPERIFDKDFAKKNKESHTLSPIFSIKNQYWLVEKTEIEQVLKMGDDDWAKIENERKRKNLPLFAEPDYDVLWKHFYKKYPKSGGYYDLSRVGFSSNKRIAIVKITQSGGVSGYTKWFTLAKNKNKWKVIKSSSSEWIV